MKRPSHYKNKPWEEAGQSFRVPEITDQTQIMVSKKVWFPCGYCRHGWLSHTRMQGKARCRMTGGFPPFKTIRCPCKRYEWSGKLRDYACFCKECTTYRKAKAGLCKRCELPRKQHNITDSWGTEHAYCEGGGGEYEPYQHDGIIKPRRLPQ